jgi:hypothetical protein
LPTVHDSRDFDTVSYRNVEDNVAADGKAAQIFCQVSPRAASKGRVCKHVERSLDPVNQGIGGFDAVRAM